MKPSSPIFMEFGQGHLPRLPRHENPGLEITFLREGHLVWECEGKTEDVPPQSLYFTLPGQKHGSTSEFEPGHYWYFVVIRAEIKAARVRFPDELGFDPATEATISRLLMREKRHVVSASRLARSLLPALVEELEKPGLLHQPRLIRMTGQLILDLVLSTAEPEPISHGAETARFAKLLAEVRNTCSDPWTLKEMASRLHLGPTRFTALFRQQTGDSPVHHLQRLRIEKARKLLRTTDASVTDIAMDCGFSSSQHLAHVFKHFTQISASEYRLHGAPELVLPRIPAKLVPK